MEGELLVLYDGRWKTTFIRNVDTVKDIRRRDYDGEMETMPWYRFAVLPCLEGQKVRKLH